MKEFLYRWKYTFNLRFKEWHKVEALRKMLVRKDSQILRSRLYKWKSLVLNLEFQIQSRVLLTRYTLRTFKISIFNAWRRVIKDHKVRRLTLINKAWKSLRAQVLDAKHRRR